MDGLAAVPPLSSGSRITLPDSALREVSGLAVRTGAVLQFWALNDSGNPAELLAVDTLGMLRQRVRVEGATNVDWEALAAGSCPSGRCLYIGDVGDNAGKRPYVTIYRVAEPGAELTAIPADRLDVRWPDGPDDVEAMTIDTAGTLWFVTKGRKAGLQQLLRVSAGAWESGACLAGSGPACTPEPVTAQVVSALALSVTGNQDWVTDGALSPDGTLLALRTYRDVLLLPVDPQAATVRIADGVRCLFDGVQVQGEGIAWLPDGRLVLASEASMGRAAQLRLVACPRPAVQ